MTDDRIDRRLERRVVRDRWKALLGDLLRAPIPDSRRMVIEILADLDQLWPRERDDRGGR